MIVEELKGQDPNSDVIRYTICDELEHVTGIAVVIINEDGEQVEEASYGCTFKVMIQ